MSEGLAQVSSQLQELQVLEQGLEARLAKRRAELERAEKRLATLAAVRPAYMDEYEQLQAQLQVRGRWDMEGGLSTMEMARRLTSRRRA